MQTRFSFDLIIRVTGVFLVFTTHCLNAFRACSRYSPLKSCHHGKDSISYSHGREASFSGDINTGNKTAESLLFRVTEIFGSLFSEKKSVDRLLNQLSKGSFNSISSNIRQEYENIFWATGNMDVSLWAPNCSFADPFNSFGGNGSRDRFKSNADNLGKFVYSPVLKITKFEANERDKVITVGWTFSGRLKLPWRPVLAAAGETSHFIDTDTGLIVRYEERWKSDPWEVVKRLFVPGK